MKIKNNAIAVLAGLALAGAAGSASAATWTFNNTITNTQGGITATASAWSNTANGPSGSNTVLESAFLNTYGSNGLGVKNKDYVTGGGDANEGVNPEHAIDNDQRRDSVLFSFSDKVNLSSTYFGWISGDADFSVYAYTGSGSGPSALNGAPTPTLACSRQAGNWSATTRAGWATTRSPARPESIPATG